VIDRRFVHNDNIVDGLEVLKKITDILKKHNIKYYLDFGTLLGAMRDEEFIRWDKNINISLLNREDYKKILKILKKETSYNIDIKKFKNTSYLKLPHKWYEFNMQPTLLGKIIYFTKKVERKMKKLGFLRKVRFFKKNNIRILSIENKQKNILLEIFFKYEKNNSFYWAAYGKIKSVPKTFIQQGLQEINFHGLTVTIPKDYNNYLTYLYEDWKTPNKEYSQEDGPSMLLEYRQKTSGDKRFSHKQNLEAMINLIRTVVEVLDKHHIKYILDMGTLLGAMREGHLLTWDDDTDLTLIDEKDFHKLPIILKEIEELTGYETNIYTIRDTQIEYTTYVDKYVKPQEIVYTDTNNYQLAKIRNRRIYIPDDVNIIMDIFCQYEYKEYNHWFMFGKVYRIPSQLWNNGFKKVNFHGIECSVPVDYDAYLSQWFGEWKEPNQDWKEDDSPAMLNEYRGQIPEDRRFIHTENQEEMIKMFHVVDTVLKHYNIEYYLDFGTLIGAARDGKFIPWDDDMDISIIHEKDFFKLPMVTHTIEQAYGYFSECYTFKHSQIEYEASEKLYVKHRDINFTNPENNQVAIIKSDEQWLLGKGNAIIDIFCKYKYNNELYWMAFGKEYKMPYKPLEEGFKEIEFYGVKCLIPIAYDEYLSGHYGEWKTPNETWDQTDSNAMIDTYRS